jgi:hypothetical protein
MKTIFAAFFILCSTAASAVDLDSVGRAIAQIINKERVRLGKDTMRYESDTFGFATSWADSTNRFFNFEGNLFARDTAHRNIDERCSQYEKTRNREWKYFSECLGVGRTGINLDSTINHYANGILGSKDHYTVLMNRHYKNIIVGVSIKRGYFAMVIFVTTEHG